MSRFKNLLPLSILSLILVIVLPLFFWFDDFFLDCGYYGYKYAPRFLGFLDRLYPTILDKSVVFPPITGFLLAILILTLGKRIASPKSKITAKVSILIFILLLVSIFGTGAARMKAPRAAIQAYLTSIRSSAEIYFDDQNYSYGYANNNCQADNSIFAQLDISKSLKAARYNGANNVKCFAEPKRWAISVELPPNSKSVGFFCKEPPEVEIWCVDSTDYRGGVVKSINEAECGEKKVN